MMENGNGTMPHAIKSVFGGDGLFWSVLSHDACVALAVVDGEGVFHAVTEPLARQMGAPVSQIVGRRMSEIFSADYAEERKGFIRQAMRSTTPVVVEEISRGVHRVTTFRSLPPEADGRQRALMVCRPAAGTQAADRPADNIRAKHDDLGGLNALTGRELEILTLIGEGLSTADIAKKLHRSVKTVEWHRVSLGNKLGVSNRVELARIAIRAGLSMLDTPQQPVVETTTTAQN